MKINQILFLIELFQSVIDKYCRDYYYDFYWKKDSYTYYSLEIKENNKSIDVSLIVNKNNDASAIDYSYEANKHEENDEQEEGNENKVNKKIKIKEIFLGEDKQLMDDNEEREEDYNDKYKKDYKEVKVW